MRDLKRWCVRYHLKLDEGARAHRDFEVNAYDREHARMLVTNMTLSAPWHQFVQRCTARRAPMLERKPPAPSLQHRR